MDLRAWQALPICLLSGAVMADEALEQRVNDLEQEVQVLREQNQESAFDRISFNGFYSVGINQANNNLGYAGSTDEYDFNNLTLVGLQGDFALADSTSVTVQLVARGEDDFSPEVEWAYLKHTFDNYITVRGGKLRLPMYMYSDYLEVGYAQPWARPPEEVYGFVPFNSFVGVDGSYDFEFDNSTLTVQGFWGQSEEDGTSYDDILGANLTWAIDDFTVRAVYGVTKITVDPTNQPDAQVLADKNKSDFLGAGFSYDNGSLLVVSEVTRATVEGQYSDVDSGYLTLGYRFGKAMPYGTVAGMKTQDDDEREGKFVCVSDCLTGSPGLLPTSHIYDGKRTSYSLGLRYDLLSNLAVKFDATLVNGFGDTNGLLESKVAGATEDSTTVYSIVFDGVF
ncbi:hypothetical protein SNR37_003979 [Agarivorans aestuarii]|uniref:Porin domain-containing protein n=1 Tax=Agarivorans aestuarii TaxID=1563703 RepID=A0ABU7G5D7_9ALTE|nr:hypothetical protein [Agarivorans aestuarii]MEE1674536.1 hypothetical protein [Agarivorans aestuarii]